MWSNMMSGEEYVYLCPFINLQMETWSDYNYYLLKLDFSFAASEYGEIQEEHFLNKWSLWNQASIDNTGSSTAPLLILICDFHSALR